MRIVKSIPAVVAALAAFTATEAQAALLIHQNDDIAAGITAFGPPIRLFTAANVFPTGTSWTTGSLLPLSASGNQTDSVTGATISGDASVGNWLDGPGFDDGPNGVGPELALNGLETFTYTFAGPVRRVGLAIA
ncbi:MAG: hypothetical protein KIS90_16775, partial [Phenylobacterium sp.]|nr:hypothetical protein [Phenylobacterium sp.]